MKTNQLNPVSPPASFRLFLQTELARRCARSRQYSLRAFARFLGLDHSTLSQLLRGKRRFTERTVRRCGIRLGLDEAAVVEFIRAEAAAPLPVEDDLRDVRRMASDTAAVLAEWYHYAILELVHLRDFRPDVRWVARVLGITVDEANVAIQRLLYLGLLSMDAPDRWSDRSGDTAASIRGFTRAALERLIDQSRGRLLDAVSGPEAERSAYSTTTVAVPAERAADVVECIERFRRELFALLARDPRAKDVYQLEISFIPLTRTNSEENRDGTTGGRLADRDSKA